MTKLKIITTPDPTLRQKSQRLSVDEIKSVKIKKLVQDIKETLKAREYGVGISAVQVGEPVAVAVIAIRPTPTRPSLKPFDRVYFNAEITDTEGEQSPMWEGCCSVLGQDGKPVYAKVPRYKNISIRYYDEEGVMHEELIDGFLAQVLQHEIDHQNGILFTDLVNESEIISFDEYRKLVKKEVV